MVDKVHQFYGPLFDSSATLRPANPDRSLDAGVPPGVPLTRARQKLVTVTLLDRTDVETKEPEGIPALRRKRLVVSVKRLSSRAAYSPWKISPSC